MDVVSLMIGGFLGGLGLTILGVGAWLIWMMMEQKKKYLIFVKNFVQGGSSYWETHKAQKILHPKLGMVYDVRKYKGTAKQYIPDMLESNEYPIMGHQFRKIGVCVAYKDGVFTPMKDDPMVTENQRFIKIVQYEDAKTGKVELRPVTHEKPVDIYVCRPLKSSMRAFAIHADTIVREEFKETQGWWDKYGGFVVAGFVIMAAIVISVLMMVFSQQHAETLASMAPFADQVAARTAEFLANTTEQTQQGILPLMP